jgi:hypothetical protein
MRELLAYMHDDHMRNPSPVDDDRHPSEPPLPSARESAEALGTRLARIGAAATTLRALSDDLREGSSREALLTLLDAVERDIVFASRQLLVVRQAARERPALDR